MKRILAALGLGVVTGSAAAALGAGHQVESLRLERDAALSEAAHLRAELDRLRRAASESPGPLVQAVSVHVEHPDPRVQQELQRLLQADLRALVGRHVAAVDPLPVLLRTQGRTLPVDGRQYRLTVRAILVGATVRVYAEAAEEPAGLTPDGPP